VGESPYEYNPNRKICFLYYLKAKQLSFRVEGKGEYGQWNVGYKEGDKETVLLSTPCDKDTVQEAVPDQFTQWYIHDTKQRGGKISALHSVSSICTKPPLPPTHAPTTLAPTLKPTRLDIEYKRVEHMMSAPGKESVDKPKRAPFCNNLVVQGPSAEQRGFDLTGDYFQYQPKADSSGKPLFWQPSYSAFYRHHALSELGEGCTAAHCSKNRTMWLFYQPEERIWAFGKQIHAAPYLAAINSLASLPNKIGGNGDGFQAKENGISWDVPQIGASPTADAVYINNLQITCTSMVPTSVPTTFPTSAPSFPPTTAVPTFVPTSLPSTHPTPVPGLQPLKTNTQPYFKGAADAVGHDQIVEVTYAPSFAPTDPVQGEAAALAAEAAAEATLLKEREEAKEASIEAKKDKEKEKMYKEEEIKAKKMAASAAKRMKASQEQGKQAAVAAAAAAAAATEEASVRAQEKKMKLKEGAAEAEQAAARAAEEHEKKKMRTAKRQETKAAAAAAVEAAQAAKRPPAATAGSQAAMPPGPMPHVELYGLAAILLVSA
jgi:hypothetical protein